MPLREEYCREVLAVVSGTEYLCGIESSVPGTRRCHHHQQFKQEFCAGIIPICPVCNRGVNNVCDDTSRQVGGIWFHGLAFRFGLW